MIAVNCTCGVTENIVMLFQNNLVCSCLVTIPTRFTKPILASIWRVEVNLQLNFKSRFSMS